MVAGQNVLASKVQSGPDVDYLALNQKMLADERSCDNSPSSIPTILREINSLKDIGFDFMSHCKKRIGNGRATKFWTDKWVLDVTFRERFPRVYALDMDKECFGASKFGGGQISDSFRRNVRDGAERQQMEALISVLANVSLTPNEDRWVCDLTGDGSFHVKEVRTFLDNLVLPSSSESTRWVKWVPIKTNYLLEGSWWEIAGEDIDSFSEWQNWFLSIRMQSGSKNLLDGVFATFWWYMWGFRNRSIFDSSTPRRS
ncbi:hypothetical protein Tco_1505991, partial [Tanacetum coccineum]